MNHKTRRLVISVAGLVSFGILGVAVALAGKPLKDWNRNDRIQADVASAAYDLVGILGRPGVVPPDMIIDNWGDSVIKCYKAAKPLIEEYRVTDRRGEHFWDDFEWLYNQAIRSPRWKQHAG